MHPERDLVARPDPPGGDLDLARAELEWLRRELDAAADISAAPSAPAGLGRLVERFGTQVGADGTALVLADEDDALPQLRHRWRLYDGSEAAAVLVLAARVMHQSPGVPLAVDDSHPGRVLVAAPVGPDGHAQGALCAVFDGRPALAMPLLEQAAGAYATLAWLRLGASEELARLRTAATLDGLTGCLNRRAIAELLVEEVSRSERHGRRLACCMLDLDRFKAVNDEHGHLAGDRVLRAVADALVSGVRVYDCVGRFGGDEFLVVMPETSLLRARDIARRLVADVRAATGELPGRLGACAGVASWSPGRTAEDLVERADRALLAAKAQGSGTVIADGRAPGG